jgi:hypothetical protein
VQKPPTGKAMLKVVESEAAVGAKNMPETWVAKVAM